MPISSEIILDYLEFSLHGESRELFDRLERCRTISKAMETSPEADMKILLKADAPVVLGRKPGYPEGLPSAEQKALLKYATEGNGWNVIDNSSNEKLPLEFMGQVALCLQTFQER